MIIVENLKLSGSKSMNVNGSSSSQVFSYSPGTGSVVLKKLSCVLKDEGTTSLSNFGALSSLTNGVLVRVTINSNSRTITTIKDNADLCTRFNQNHFGSASVLNLLGITTPVGFGNTNNAFIGSFNFGSPIVLNNTDSIEIVIQDNLTNIDLFEMIVEAEID